MRMRMSWEVNGNIPKIDGFQNFYDQIHATCSSVSNTLDVNPLATQLVFIDNATGIMNKQPITIPVLSLFLLIKLSISDFSKSSQIAFQLSHELCHCYFFEKLGIKKPLAREKEENYCTAFSLFIIENMFPSEIEYYVNQIKTHPEPKYQKGYPLFVKYRGSRSDFLREMETHINSLRAG